jgi:prophage regulatory protein
MDRLYRIVRKHDLPNFVGLQRTAIEEMIAAGDFPRPVPLNDNGRSVGWLEHELIAWQQSRIAKRDRSPKEGRDDE